MQYYLSHGRAGDTDMHGPYTVEEVRARVASGEFDLRDYFWHDGLADWKSIAELPFAVVAPRDDNTGQIILAVGVCIIMLGFSAVVLSEHQTMADFSYAGAMFVAGAVAIVYGAVLMRKKTQPRASARLG